MYTKKILIDLDGVLNEYEKRNLMKIIFLKLKSALMNF